MLLHGAATARGAITAGLLDQIEIHLVPVLIGGRASIVRELPSSPELQLG
ncbi:MAG: dihydrofolate reductase family protein [Microbacterium ginsengisoli]|nr:dihydrofolate reductase family protein [Microbacterium ginsengisoli]